MKHIENFIEKEKSRKDITLYKYPNGEELIYENYQKYNILHCFYNKLSDEQIKFLQDDVNISLNSDYIFPEWYKDFLKVSNGMNIYFGAISLYGEQTPMTITEHGTIKALIKRDDPNWIAPYNLRFPGDEKYEPTIANRWLVIGGYYYDGTKIVYDYKLNKLIAMYSLPIKLSIKDWKKMKEYDYEKLIICEWKDFQTFFISETNRLSDIINKYVGMNQEGFTEWKKTLPPGHKNFEI